jgi:hypothetical protein
VGSAAHMEEKYIQPDKKNYQESLNISETIIIQWILEKYVGRA